MNSAIGQELIERLSAGIRPIQAGESSKPSVGDEFATMLLRAAGGAQPTSVPVTVGRGVDAELEPEMLERLGMLVDRAQAEGASRALVMTDDGLLQLDVLRRRIEAVVDPALDGDVITGFDAVLDARTVRGDAAELTGPLLLPDRGWSASSHDSLLQALTESGSINR